MHVRSVGSPRRRFTLLHPLLIQGSQSGSKSRGSIEELGQGYLENGVSGDVGSGQFESTVDHELLVLEPTAVSEALQTVERCPFTGFSVENFKG